MRSLTSSFKRTFRTAWIRLSTLTNEVRKMSVIRCLWRVSRPEEETPFGYDEFDSFVCVAATAGVARRLHPRGEEIAWSGWRLTAAGIPVFLSGDS